MTIWVLVLMWGPPPSHGISLAFGTKRECYSALKTVSPTPEVEKDLIFVCREVKTK